MSTEVRGVPPGSRHLVFWRAVIVRDERRAEIVISPIRWRESRRLLIRVLTRTDAASTGRGLWRLELDTDTEQRLDRIIEGW